MKKVEAVRAVLADMPDAQAAEVAEAVWDRYGIETNAAYCRVVKSRAAREDSSEPRSALSVPASRSLPGPVMAAQQIAAPALRAPAPARRAPGPARRAPAPRPPARDESDQEYAWVMRLLDKTIEGIGRALSGQPQRITGDEELIRNIEGVLSDPEVKADWPGYTWDTYFGPGDFKTLVLYAEGTRPYDPPLAKGIESYAPLPMPAKPGKAKRKQSERGCDFCGRQKGFATSQLYAVTGGAIGPRTRILCAMHAQAEAAGYADVKPYRQPPTSGFGLVKPEPSAFARMIADAGKSLIDVMLAPESEDTD